MTTKKGNPRKLGKKGRQPRCGYLGCKHHQGHPGPHTWSEGR